MKTALVVDESPRWRGQVAEALREQGWVVTTAAALPDPAGGGHDLAVLEWAPDPAGENALTVYLNAPANRATRSVLLIPRPMGGEAAPLRAHPAVLGVLDKGAWSTAALLDLTRPVAAEPAAPPPAGADAGPKVLVVEDDAAWRAIYAELLAEAGYAPYFAVSYGEARGWLQHETFDLAIVDLNLASSAAPAGNRDGFFLLRAAKQRNVPALVVSALGDPDDIDRAYDEFGIFTFVETEGFDRRNFARLVAAAWRARQPVPAADETPTALERLTPREREVLALLTQGYTNRQIAEALLISANTTKKHVDHILQKLGAGTRAGAVALAMGGNLKETNS
ncbi:MAG: response regulator transcription factor [Anaerolineales bacterium]|nr:response regulator transcription factor [Anaerolineales bacterium]